MPGHRFFIDLNHSSKLEPGALVELSKSDSHHARDVLRLRIGAEVTIVARDGEGSFRAEIRSIDRNCTAEIISEITGMAPQSRVSSLLFGLCKGDKNDLVCEKATELGVGSIHFFQAERSVMRLDSHSDREKKRSRWLKIAEGAAKQCGRDSMPEVMISGSLEEALHFIPEKNGASLFFCSFAKDAKEPRMIAPPPGLIHLCIGPEGSLSDAEEELLRRHSGLALSLGPTVLRSETAALAAVAMTLAVWGYSAKGL